MRVGDFLRHNARAWKIKAIEAYHDAYYANGAERPPSLNEGYEIAGSPDERPADKPLPRFCRWAKLN